MHVHMHARLAAGFSHVDADVVSIRSMLGLNLFLRLAEQGIDCRMLLRSQVKNP
jgi:hypothetical protein